MTAGYEPAEANPMMRVSTSTGCWYRLASILALGVAAWSLTGCDDEDSACVVSAVHPFYTPQDLDSDGAIVGAWKYQDEVTFVFTPGDNNILNVTVEEEVEPEKRFTSRFEGHLFRLGPDSFLDLYPASVPEGSEFYLLHFFRCHTVAKVDLSAGRLEMRFVSPAWLASQIKEGAVTIAHAKSDEILLLTATTEEMQELLYLNASDENAFGEAVVFERTGEEEEQ